MDEDGDLKPYLKAALKREALLLDPPEDLKRVKRGRLPTDYGESIQREAAREAHFEDNRYHYWLRDEVRRLRGEATWSVFRWLSERSEYREIIKQHLQTATGSPEHPPRADQRQWLALLRPLEPLAARTGGVERSCAELHRDNQLQTFLRNALANERMLLDREDPKARLEQRRRRDLAWLDELEGNLRDAEEDAGADDGEAEAEA